MIFEPDLSVKSLSLYSDGTQPKPTSQFLMCVVSFSVDGMVGSQIGSSLAGSAVQGAIAGEAAAIYSKEIELKDISTQKVEAIKAEILAPLKREAGFSPAWVTQTLQGIMIPNFVLYIKILN